MRGSGEGCVPVRGGRATPHPFDLALTSVSFVVRDLASTVAAYARLFGWGPFHVFDEWFEGPDNLLRGRPVRYRLRWAECVVPPGIDLEFIQPVEGPGVWSEWLAGRGEGVYCLGTMMRSNEEAEALRRRFAEEGVDTVMRGALGKGIAWHLLDTVGPLKALVITGGGHAIDWDDTGTELRSGEPGPTGMSVE
jgi:hypothetical protein